MTDARRWLLGSVLSLAVTTVAASALGQTPTAPEEPLLGSTLSADVIRDLPTSNTPFALLENLQAESIGDRFSAGGLNPATAPRFGGFLNSWTQTQFRIGDMRITDPLAGGTPLLMPVLSLWERVTIVNAAMGIDDNASGLSVTLDPLRPGSRWLRAIDGVLSAPDLVSDGDTVAPAVDRVHSWQDGSVMVSGPIANRLGLVAAASWRRLSHLAAPSATTATDRVASGFAHLVLAATPRDEFRLLGWAQQASTTAVTDTAVHVQSTWERREPGRLAWRVFGGYTGRSRSAPAASSLVVDSLTSDPVSDVVSTGAGSVRRWTLGARANRQASRFLSSIGADLEGARVLVDPTGIEQVRELVDGIPARLWSVKPGSGIDGRHLTSLAVFGNQRVTAGRLTLDAGLRLETIAGSADSASNDIQWTTLLPRAVLRWRLIGTAGLAAVTSYRRSAYQLPLNVLAVGDPAAPVADVSIWRGASTGPLIARVGPGTGGDATFAQIDPQLQRPITDEGVLKIESRPIKGLQLELAAILKREQSLLGLTNAGVLSSAYTAFQVPDPSFEPGSPQGGPQVTVYNRPSGAYGRDRYLVTNQKGDPATFWGVDANIRTSTRQFMVLAGATIWTRTVAPAAAVGFLPTENDQDVLGNLFVDPNAATSARGQIFPDRSHTVKVAGIYRFPGRVSLGALARYQDGQPFARLVIVPDLTQGTTVVRGYVNGGTAFTYTGTLDVRIQKVFTTGRSEVTAMLDVYNLPNLSNEVTERVVSGSMFRQPTALQPPRTALVGVRVTF